MSVNITDFFKKEYVNWASYDNYRSLPSCIDGLKISARKVIYTMIEQKIKEPKKVAQLKAKISEFTNYLHGDDALIGVIVGLAQKFAGSNNITLLNGQGNFGNKLNPTAAADRYIFAGLAPVINKVFRPEDTPVLISQYFEGDKIEPKFFVPVLPLVLVNGSMDSLSVGFASNILPRKPSEVAQAIFDILDGKEPERIEPWFKGFKGLILRNQEGGLEVRGTFNKLSPKEIQITELPVGITLAKYRELIDTQEEKKIVTSWKDLSDTKKDVFNFRVKLAKVIPDNEICTTLKLVKKFSENFTCMDENNQLRIFKNEVEIVKHFVNVRLEFYEKRKLYQIAAIEREIQIIRNKLEFLKLVISGKLVVFKRKKMDVCVDLEKLNFEKIDESFDYLLRLPIDQFTTDKVNELVEKYKNKKAELEEAKVKDCKEWWKEEIKELLDVLKD